MNNEMNTSTNTTLTLKERRFKAMEAFCVEKGWDVEDIDAISKTEFEVTCEGEYLVLTEDEATELAEERARENLWACNGRFLDSHLKSGIYYRMLQDTIERECEGANELVESCIEDVDACVREIIATDGRELQLSTYDGIEHTLLIDGTLWCIYRTN